MTYIDISQITPVTTYETDSVQEVKETVEQKPVVKQKKTSTKKKKETNVSKKTTKKKTKQVIEEPVQIKKVHKKLEYTAEMIDWNEPESADWDYNKMGLDGWELCNVELNTRTNFTTALFRREIPGDENTELRKFEYEIKTRYWTNKLESDVWTYEEMGLNGWELCHILDDEDSQMTEFYFKREIIE